MRPIARVLVGLAKGNARPQRAGFLQSVTGHFCDSHQDEAMVSCGLDRHHFVISDSEFTGSTRLLLKRPSFCPIKHLEERQAASLPEELRGRGVDVGAAIVLQSVDRRVLLTRRAKDLRNSPNIWVPPGGHVDVDEQLLEAGLRELLEETGLRLEPASFSWRMLGLWEAVYPPLLSRGLPRHHHVVTYLLLLSTESSQQLQRRITADKHEVSAYAWLEPPVLEAVAAIEDGAGSMRSVPSHLPQTIKATELSGGSPQPMELPTATFLNAAPATGQDVERGRPATSALSDQPSVLALSPAQPTDLVLPSITQTPGSLSRSLHREVPPHHANTVHALGTESKDVGSLAGPHPMKEVLAGTVLYKEKARPEWIQRE